MDLTRFQILLKINCHIFILKLQSKWSVYVLCGIAVQGHFAQRTCRESIFGVKDDKNTCRNNVVVGTSISVRCSDQLSRSIHRTHTNEILQCWMPVCLFALAVECLAYVTLHNADMLSHRLEREACTLDHWIWIGFSHVLCFDEKKKT